MRNKLIVLFSFIILCVFSVHGENEKKCNLELKENNGVITKVCK